MQNLVVKVREGEIVFKSAVLKGADIKIYREDGEMVFARENHPIDHLTVKNLKKGVYKYTINSGGQSLSGRVVVI